MHSARSDPCRCPGSKQKWDRDLSTCCRRCRLQMAAWGAKSAGEPAPRRMFVPTGLTCWAWPPAARPAQMHDPAVMTMHAQMRQQRVGVPKSSQLSLSVPTSLHTPLQDLVPLGQAGVHTPAWHCSLLAALHALPQAPHCSREAWLGRPFGRVPAFRSHATAENQHTSNSTPGSRHRAPALGALPTCWLLDANQVGLGRHAPSQDSVVAGSQPHCPFRQTAPDDAGQLVPHRPPAPHAAIIAA